MIFLPSFLPIHDDLTELVFYAGRKSDPDVKAKIKEAKKIVASES